MAGASAEKGQNKNITELCINIIFYCRINNISYHFIKEMINTFTFYNYPVAKMIQGTDENKYTKFVKGCIGLDIIPVIEKPIAILF